MSDRLGEEELEEVTNLISKKFIPEIIRIADTYNYDRDSLTKYVADLFSTMAEVATFENYNVSPVSNSENPNKWIPVSERLPEESGRYLTYIVNEYDEKLQYIMTADYIARPTPIEGLSPWYVDDECASDNVVAWQPLPEPYKAEKGGE